MVETWFSHFYEMYSQMFFNMLLTNTNKLLNAAELHQNFFIIIKKTKSDLIKIHKSVKSVAKNQNWFEVALLTCDWKLNCRDLGCKKCWVHISAAQMRLKSEKNSTNNQNFKYTTNWNVWKWIAIEVSIPYREFCQNVWLDLKPQNRT